MAEHLLNDDIKNYIKRQMKPSDLLRADEHLAVCDLCFQQLGDLQPIQKSFDLSILEPSPEESEHLSYQQLENYVDEKSNKIEREIADVHLQACADCRSELDGLFEMRKLIETDTQNQVFVPLATETRDSNLFWKLISGKYPWPVGFAATGLLLVGFLFGIYWFLQPQKSNEIASNSSTPKLTLPVNSSPENLSANLLPNINKIELTNKNIEANLPKSTPTPFERETLPPAYQAEIERVLAVGNLNIPHEIKQLKQQNGKLMGGGTEGIPFALSTPVGKIIQSNRPRFQWQALDGATAYLVKVYDSNFNEVASSSQISGTAWQINRPLPPGKIYLWQVTATQNGQEIKSPVRPAPDAKFKILEAKNTAELNRLSRQYKNEHLFLGIMYSRAGLLDEAEREFQKEIAKNRNSKPARKFLQELQKRK